MTNLSAGRPSGFKRFLILIGMPMVIGVVVASGITFVGVRPKMVRWLEQKRAIDELRAQESNFPALLAQLEKSDEALIRVQRQQDLVVDLIASRDRIQTFLAQVGREGASSGVTLDLYEPAVEESPTDGEESKKSNAKGQQKKDASSGEKSATTDPLETRGYQKTSVLLRATGRFQDLKSFLRRMERLKLLVQPSDLQLNAVDADDVKEGQVIPPPLTELKLRLSFYDKTVQIPENNQTDQLQPPA